MKAIEALEVMKNGTKVALYWPDCEMFQSPSENVVELFLPDYSYYAADAMSNSEFLKNYPQNEFVLYDEK